MDEDALGAIDPLAANGDASEYAHHPTILVAFAACVLVPALLGRSWTLLLPVALTWALSAPG